MKVVIHHEVPAYAGYAAERTRGLYNVEVEDGQRFDLVVDVPVEREDWQIGVVVGPSGSGKTSIARALEEHSWHEHRVGRWPKDAPVIEAMTKWAGDYAKATAAMASVGFGAVPSWLRPYAVLSNGEQFRVEMARLLVVGEDQVMLDEFTSVLDRQVAKVGAGAFAKRWRRRPGRRVILITPHYDVLEWVQPDWIVDTAGGDQLGGGEVTAGSATFSHGREAFPGPVIGSIVVGGGEPTTYVRV